MKKKLLILLTLLCTVLSNAQDQFEITVPIKTSHFYSKEFRQHNFVEGEGGDMGTIISYIDGKGDRKLKDNYSAGVFRNSYGKWSLMGTYGKRYFFTQKFSIGLNFGIATNYKDSYYKHISIGKDEENNDILLKTPLKNKQKNFKFLYNNSLQPLVAFQVNQQVTKAIGVGFLVNPYHITMTANIVIK